MCLAAKLFVKGMKLEKKLGISPGMQSFSQGGGLANPMEGASRVAGTNRGPQGRIVRKRHFVILRYHNFFVMIVTHKTSKIW